MVRPEDIEKVKGISSGQYVEKSEQNIEIDVDKVHKTVYNTREENERALARKNFYKDQEKHRDEEESRKKQQRKEDERKENERKWKRSLRKKD